MAFSDGIAKYLRMNNIFGGGMSNNEMMPQPRNINMIDDSESDDANDARFFSSRMSQLYQPEHEMTDKFHSMIDTMPQRNHPGFLRKMAATAAAFHSPEAVDRALYDPYNGDLADFQTHLKPVEDAAKLEMSNNVNLRSVANQILSQEAGQRRLERQIGRDRVLSRQGDARIAGTEANRNRTGDQRDRALDQNDRRITQNDVLKYQVDDNGKDVIITKDGRTIPVEGLDYVSAEEKASWKKKYSASGGRDRFRTEVVQDRNNPNGPGILVKVNLDTDEVVPLDWGGPKAAPKPKPGPLTPVVKESKSTQETGEAKDITGKAQRFINSNTQLGKYVKIDKQGKVTIQRPGWGGYTGPSEAERQKIYKAIYGAQGPGQSGTELANKKVLVRRKSDGQKGMVTNPDPKLYDIIEGGQ